MNLDAYPARMVTSEVLEVARFGRGELRARIKKGTFPKPVDRGGEGFIFLKTDVLAALGLGNAATAENPFEAALAARRQRRSQDETKSAPLHRPARAQG